MRTGCRSKTGEHCTGFRPTRNGHSRQTAATGTTPAGRRRPILRSAGSPATTRECESRAPLRRGAAAVRHLRRNEHGLRHRRQCLGMDEYMFRSHQRSSRPVRAMSNIPIAACGSPRAQHRTYVTDFIRDARAGGCAAGVPPTNLGFRLVREPPKAWAGLIAPSPAGKTAPCATPSSS